MAQRSLHLFRGIVTSIAGAMVKWGINSLTGLGGLRRRKDTRDEKILGVGEAEIAGDNAEIGAALVLVFADGLEYGDTAREVNVDEGGLPLLRADLDSSEFHSAAVNPAQQAVAELDAIHQVAHDFGHAFAIGIDQKRSGETVDDPRFVGRGSVAGVGTKIDAEEIFFNAIEVIKESVRHHGQEILQLELVIVLGLF